MSITRATPEATPVSWFPVAGQPHPEGGVWEDVAPVEVPAFWAELEWFIPSGAYTHMFVPGRPLSRWQRIQRRIREVLTRA